MEEMNMIVKMPGETWTREEMEEIRRDAQTCALPICARADGVDPGWLRETADEIAALMSELAQLRRMVSPRRLRTLELARRVKVLRNKGVAAAALQQRFGVSRTRIYQLIELSSKTLDNDALSSSHELLEEKGETD